MSPSATLQPQTAQPQTAQAKTAQAKSDPLPGIERRPTFLVHRINAELARIGNPLFRRLGVDLITSRILVLLLERDQAYVGDIVEIMSLPQSTVSHQLKRLESAELVLRQPDEVDQRVFIVTLTAKGRGVAKQCNQMSDEIYAHMFADVDAARMDVLVGELEALALRLRTLKTSNLKI